MVTADSQDVHTDLAQALQELRDEHAGIRPTRSPAPSYMGKAVGDRRCCSTLGNAKSLVMNVADHLREARVSDVDAEILEGPVARVILNSAKSRNPDLLVLGARGLDAASEGVLLGSVTRAVTYRAECPVLVVKQRAGLRTRRCLLATIPVHSPLRLLLAVDGSRYSEAEAALVAGITWPAGSSVCVLAVVPERLPLLGLSVETQRMVRFRSSVAGLPVRCSARRR